MRDIGLAPPPDPSEHCNNASARGDKASRSPWYFSLDTRPYARHCSRSTGGAIHAGPVPRTMTRHRIQLASRLGAPLIAAAWLIGGGVPAWGAVQTYNVNCTADVTNSTSSSKVCATAAPVSACSCGMQGQPQCCTLRAAIQASNANVYTDTIEGRNENAFAATGDLDITDAVNITGAGASSVIIDGNRIDRVFDVFANGTTTISGVTIRNGKPGGTCSTTTTQICLTDANCPSPQTCRLSPGGGIQTGAIIANNVVTLNLSKVVVTQNTSGAGGGIANSDILSLTDVTVSNNICAGTSCFGGGIFNKNGGTATLNRVTLSGNSATGGGGLGSDSDVNLTNVTIYGNTASSGSAIKHTSGTATLINVTISNNTADPEGGAFVNLGNATFKYTIFAHDPASEACMDVTGIGFTSGGHNIDVGTSCEDPCMLSTDCPTGTTCTSNLCQGTGDIINTNPAVAPLANNGGPTFTQALFAGSAALDKGGTDCPSAGTLL